MALDVRTQLHTALAGHGLAEDHAVRVADRHEHRLDAAGGRVQVDTVGLALEARRQVGGPKGSLPDVDLADDLRAVAAEHLDGVGAVDGAQLEAVGGAVLEHGVSGRDAQAVAALLGLRAVRVEDAHGHRPWIECEQPVRAEASEAVAQHGEQRHELVQRTRQVEHEVVVAEGLVLDQVDLRQGLNKLRN